MGRKGLKICVTKDLGVLERKPWFAGFRGFRAV
jgi:hypothetical protein